MVTLVIDCLNLLHHLKIRASFDLFIVKVILVIGLNLDGILREHLT